VLQPELTPEPSLTSTSYGGSIRKDLIPLPLGRTMEFILYFSQCHPEICDSLKALFGILSEASRDDLLHRLGNAIRKSGKRCRFHIQDGGKRRNCGIGLECPATVQHFVQDRAENIGPRIDRFSLCLFR
jgi:hypothetical protein